MCDDVDDCVGDYDAVGVCGGECAEDVDADGVCDDVDDCVGQYDECGACNGPGGCDCNGSEFDAIGVCGGDCLEDVDADGICDDIDECVGELDSCGVCNGPGPMFECECDDIPDGDCDCDGNQLDALGVCGGTCEADLNDNGICDVDDVAGCNVEWACNFDPNSTINDGSCYFANAIYDCNGNCQVDANNNGICDQVEDTNTYCLGPDCCSEGTLWDNQLGACVPFNECPEDINGDGQINTGDLLNLLSAYGLSCDDY